MLHVFSDKIALADANVLAFFLTTLLPVWIFGLVTGLICPRQPVLSDVRAWLGTAAAGVVSLGARSTLLSQAMMFVNGAMFVQSLWYRFTEPGTFRGLCARIAALFGVTLSPRAAASNDGEADVGQEGDVKTWYITKDDLDFFVDRIESDSHFSAGPWETIVDKAIPGVVKYHSMRRMLKTTGKTEYLSTSITADSTPHEVMDFYLSDPARQGWDNLLTHAETILEGDFVRREQVVHWIRSFPFAFLSDRSYVIARRMFEQGGKLYGISKVIKFPGHDAGRTVRMDNYWSMWSCEAVPCPFGTDKPATKTVLMHMEDFKIAEHLSRFAVKCGMWGYIKQMSPHLTQFIADRRARGVDPNGPDPQAFGAPDTAAAAPRRALRPSASDANLLQTKTRRRLRRVASAVVAGSMLLALGATASGNENNLRRRPRGSQSLEPPASDDDEDIAC